MQNKILKSLSALLFSGVFFLYAFLLFPVRFLTANALQTSPQSDFTFSAQMSSFSTWYSQNDGGRCANISLAAQFINGVTLQPYGEFSFNKRVGQRTKEAGFRDAKIIFKGEFIQGVGGGVCQVSTTLYNAALLAGMTVTEFHPHSLPVSYVPPSRDAMVSSGADLVFTNPYSFPVRIKATAEGDSVTVRFYGNKKGAQYKIVSVVTGEIPPPAPLEKEEKEGVFPREGRKGLKSEAYLEGYQKGVLISRKLLRADAYAPQRGIVVKKNADTTKKMP